MAESTVSNQQVNIPVSLPLQDIHVTVPAEPQTPDSSWLLRLHEFQQLMKGLIQSLVA